jgi:ABC-2 type transport system permease protein
MIVLAGLLMAPAQYLPAAGALVLLTLLISAGMDNFLSILFPIPVPPPGASPYAAGSRGLGAAMVGAALLLAVVVLCAPFIFLVWLPALLSRPVLWLVTLPLALGGAAAVYAMLVLTAERLLLRREPELLERILGEA